MLSGGVLGWFASISASWITRLLLIAAALLMIEGGLWTDLTGIALAVLAFVIQKQRKTRLATAGAL
jgi:TRAP-type uncharacterized transport system fused permease subunit